MVNEKICQNINYFFFPIKTFFKWILNYYPKGPFGLSLLLLKLKTETENTITK